MLRPLAKSPALAALGLLALITALHSTGATPDAIPDDKGNTFDCKGGKKSIASELKCDGNRDCSDGSDEVEAECNKLPTLELTPGTVKLVTTTGKNRQGVVFQLCDASSCNKAVLEGFDSHGTVRAWTATDCNLHGGSCKSSNKLAPTVNWLAFPNTAVFKVVLQPYGLAIWLRDERRQVVTLPAKPGSTSLRIRPYFWNTGLDVQFGDDVPYWAPESDPHPYWSSANGKCDPEYCGNGGVYLRSRCHCPPGFAGSRCEIACGPDSYGAGCTKRCSQSKFAARRALGCMGVKFCNEAECICATGLQGEHCNEGCDFGRYGSSCRLGCGQCAGLGGCDPYTGKCLGGCRPGYSGHTCHKFKDPAEDLPPVTIPDEGPPVPV